MKRKLLILALIPFFALGCNDLFDTGDFDKTWDGLELGLFPLSQEVSIEEDGGTSIEVQLIGEQQDQDVSVDFTVSSPEDGGAEEGVHYNLVTTSPVTIEAGTSTVDIEIDFIEDSLDDGESVTLVITLEDSSDVEPSPNLLESVTTIVE